MASRDVDFCNRIFHETARNDEFVRRILELYNKTRSKVLEKVDSMHPIDFTIVRNDYLFDEASGCWTMVEYNTIAAGLGTLSNRLQTLNYNLSRGPLKEQYKCLLAGGAVLPQSQGYELTQDAMYQAWQRYGKSQAIVLIIHEFR